jgi:hypothetical protein
MALAGSRDHVSDLLLSTSADADALQRTLGAFNHARLTPNADVEHWEHRLAREHELKRIEGCFVEAERRRVQPIAQRAPRDPDAFMAWFERLKSDGPGQNDPLFPWLAKRATLDQMTWFLKQEMAGEAGFDDLVALTQLRLPVQAKLELARNYWDELGQGKASGMHGPMLERLGAELGIVNDGEAVWESLALANLMVALAANRHYAYQSLGALGVIEMTAPGRSQHVNEGLKRLGVGGDARRYFAMHATLDVKHSEAWNREVLHPLVASNPEVAAPIAEGALLRLSAGARCFERYRAELGVA